MKIFLATIFLPGVVRKSMIEWNPKVSNSLVQRYLLKVPMVTSLLHFFSINFIVGKGSS